MTLTLDHLSARAHALYSPSRLPFLEQCPGWIGDGAASDAAERGTVIGALLAAYVVDGVDPYTDAPEDWREAIRAGVERLDAICQRWPGLVWSAEDRVDPGIPETAGYCDLVGRDELVGDAVLIEIKTGRGERAAAAHNRQIQSLALGLLVGGAAQVTAYLLECDRDTVSEAVFADAAPLRSVVSSLVLSATYAGERDLRAGPYCGYCGRREQCPASADTPRQAMEALGETTLTPASYAERLSPEALGETLTRVAPLVACADAYLGALQARAMALIEAGAEVPGWRVKEGNGQRAWADEGAAALALQEAGHDLGEVMALASPAQVERRLGRAVRPIVDAHTVMGRRRSLVEDAPR